MRRKRRVTPARRLLLRRARAVLRTLGAVRARARPGDVHDLRVATRRLQEAVDLIDSALPERERARVLRRARRIRRGLAEVRDADVLVETLASLAATSAPADRATLAALRPALEARARRARAAAAGVARGRVPAGVAGGGLPVPGLRRRLAALAAALMPVPGRDLAALADRLLAARAAAVREGLRRARTGRAADLHRLRIAVKKYRYTLELMHEAGFGKHARAIGAARRLQETLGRVHDVDVLLRLLRRGNGRGRGADGRRRGGRPAIPAAISAERRALAARALAVASRFRPAGGRAAS